MLCHEGGRITVFCLPAAVVKCISALYKNCHIMGMFMDCSTSCTAICGIESAMCSLFDCCKMCIGSAVLGVGLHPLECFDRGFESH